jgi:UDP-N-acetylmuramate dehydrogenase
VRAASGVTLTWEIIRLGEALPGRPTGEALVEGSGL